jgi:hypothetical protein
MSNNNADATTVEHTTATLLLRSQQNAEFVDFLGSFFTDRGTFASFWRLNFYYGNRILAFSCDFDNICYTITVIGSAAQVRFLYILTYSV